MNIFHKIELLSLSLIFSACQSATLMGNEIPNTTESIQITRLSDNKTLFASNPQKTLIPASISKLVTSAATLVKLGAFATIPTRFYRTGDLRNGQIKGDLIVQGGGNPYLVSEDLWQIAADLKHMGIQSIQGNLILDNSLFPEENWDEGREAGIVTSEHAYDAPVSALMINFNTYAVAIAPGDSPHQQAQVAFDPNPIQGVGLINQVKTTPSGGSTQISLTREVTKDGARLIAKGTIPLGSPIKKIYRSAQDPVQAGGEIIRGFLTSQGITLKGKIQGGTVPNSATLLLTHQSKPMGEIIKGLNFYSNNMIADSLVKYLGANFPQGQKPLSPKSGSNENGLAVLSQFLREDVKISTPFQFKNGSGLSTNNSLSAEQLVATLIYMAKRSDLFPEYWSSLPTAGFTGSLAKRFYASTTQHLRGRIRAKTGTLSQPVSVVSLAGYFVTEQHGICAFAIIQNGKPGANQPSIATLQQDQENDLANILKKI